MKIHDIMEELSREYYEKNRRIHECNKLIDLRKRCNDIKTSVDILEIRPEMADEFHKYSLMIQEEDCLIEWCMTPETYKLLHEKRLDELEKIINLYDNKLCYSDEYENINNTFEEIRKSLQDSNKKLQKMIKEGKI